jgi:hypothetical protein
MTEDELDRPCGRYLKFRDLIEAGETWRRVRVPNLPVQADTVAALEWLAEGILDPVAEKFGRLEITYGFASPTLMHHVAGRIDPARDQHAGCELRRNGRPICPRLGQAADFRVPGVCSGRIAAWVACRLPFDRLYFYGPDLPLHISIGPQNSRAITTMFRGPSGRRVPRTRSSTWLMEQFGAF